MNAFHLSKKLEDPNRMVDHSRQNPKPHSLTITIRQYPTIRTLTVLRRQLLSGIQYWTNPKPTVKPGLYQSS